MIAGSIHWINFSRIDRIESDAKGIGFGDTQSESLRVLFDTKVTGIYLSELLRQQLIY